MACPRCKNYEDILRFAPMRMIEEFAEETVPVYKCPGCRWIFAPANDVVIDMVVSHYAKQDEKEVVPA